MYRRRRTSTDFSVPLHEFLAFEDFGFSELSGNKPNPVASKNGFLLFEIAARTSQQGRAMLNVTLRYMHATCMHLSETQLIFWRAYCKLPLELLYFWLADLKLMESVINIFNPLGIIISIYNMCAAAAEPSCPPRLTHPVPVLACAI